MAYLRLGYISENKDAKKGGRHAGLQYAVNYIFDPAKTENKYIAFYGGGENFIVNTGNVCERMIATKEYFGKPDMRQAYHYKLSFPAGQNVTPELAMKITKELIEKTLSGYETAYSVHTNTEHIHSHLVFNSVSFIDGLKYHYSNGDWEKILQPMANKICEKYGLAGFDLTLDEENVISHRKKNFDRWEAEKEKKPSADMLRISNADIVKDINICIKNADNFSDFIKNMTDKGYDVDDNPRHKYMTVLAPGRKKRCRVVNLTPDKATYTRENIEKMIDGSYYMSRDEVKQRLFADMESYFDTKGFVFGGRFYGVPRIFTEADFMKKSGIKEKSDAKSYMAYLNLADKELNIIRKRVNTNLSAYKGEIDNLNTILKLYDFYKLYKKGDMRFKDDYDKTIAAYKEIKASGCELIDLYKYQKSGNECISQINDYKKHIWYERKMCERTLRNFSKEEKKQRLEKKENSAKLNNHNNLNNRH